LATSRLSLKAVNSRRISSVREVDKAVHESCTLK
jgi:hypothetical protein